MERRSVQHAAALASSVVGTTTVLFAVAFIAMSLLYDTTVFTYRTSACMLEKIAARVEYEVRVGCLKTAV